MTRMKPVERPLTAIERTALQAHLSRLSTPSMRIRRGLANALVYFAVTLLIYVVAWRVAAWLAMKVTRIDFGWKSPWALQILALGAAVSCTCAALSTLRWMRDGRDTRPLVLRDLAGGVATEENLVFALPACRRHGTSSTPHSQVPRCNSRTHLTSRLRQSYGQKRRNSARLAGRNSRFGWVTPGSAHRPVGTPEANIFQGYYGWDTDNRRKRPLDGGA